MIIFSSRHAFPAGKNYLSYQDIFIDIAKKYADGIPDNKNKTSALEFTNFNNPDIIFKLASESIITPFQTETDAFIMIQPRYFTYDLVNQTDILRNQTSQKDFFVYRRNTSSYDLVGEMPSYFDCQPTFKSPIQITCNLDNYYRHEDLYTWNGIIFKKE